MLEDDFKERLQVRSQFGGIAGLGGDSVGIDHRELCLCIAGPQFNEQIEGLVENPLRVGALAIDLVDHYNRPMAHF